jgi:hypothetical protein
MVGIFEVAARIAATNAHQSIQFCAKRSISKQGLTRAGNTSDLGVVDGLTF